KSAALPAPAFLAACVTPTQPQPPPHPRPPAQTQAATPPAEAATPAPPTNTIEAKTAKLQLIDGFLPLYWDAEGGKLLMRITHVSEELIFATSLPGGLGSNPVGLDRAALGENMIVRFERIGPKVLMVAQNYRYRALTNDAA